MAMGCDIVVEVMQRYLDKYKNKTKAHAEFVADVHYLMDKYHMSYKHAVLFLYNQIKKYKDDWVLFVGI